MKAKYRSNSIHASLRQLLELGLSKSSSAEPQKITRTAKFKINTDIRPDLVPVLNRHFDAFEKFRRKVLDELEARWNKDQKSFQAMVQCSAKEPYQKKSSCYAWLDTHFITEAKAVLDLPRKPATSLLYNLSGGLKGFLTRRETVTEDIQKRFNDNLREWNGDLSQLASDLKAPLPPAPPNLDFENLTERAIERYNDWVGRTRAWCNLILVQQKKVERRDACLPRYLKGYPGFFGSQRYATTASLAENLKKLEQEAREQSKKAPTRFAKLSPEIWTAIQERFSPPEGHEAGEKRRPRTAHQTVCLRFAALRAAHPEWTPAQLAGEILAGIFHGTEKLKKHLAANGFEDRRAVIKLANLYNVVVAFSLDPIRAAGNYISFYKEETPKRNAFGDVRGGLHQPSDESAAIEIMGFGLQKESGKPLYNGLLVCKKSEKEHDDSWAFLYCHTEGQMFELANEKAKLRGKLLTDWTGFASRGGSRKKAEASAKQLVRGRVWISEKTPPTVMPLAFGSRQGREYLWHFDRDLREKNEWVLGNGRLLRIMPPGRPNAADFYLTITLERQAPPVAEFIASKLIGIDRGEAVPAAYALIDREGRWLVNQKRFQEFLKALGTWHDELDEWWKKNKNTPINDRVKRPRLQWTSELEDGFGFVASEYREQQADFNDQKRELQRTQGGYTRWLRSKERNRARALGGEVTRAVLSLASEHRSPLVLEKLGSALATRGGKGTMMSQMQYERMLTTLEQKLAEVGLYAMPSAPKYRKLTNGFINFAAPHYTSSTCSSCGQVHDSIFYNELAKKIVRPNDSKWQVTLPSGQTRTLPQTYSYWLKGKGEQTKQTNERLNELLGERTVTQLSKSSYMTLVSLLKNSWLPYRPQQADFCCLNCGYTTNADVQGALNIARKFLFRSERGKKTDDAGEEGEAKRGKYKDDWQTWYRQKLEKVWCK
jgi:hypothetical protein